MTLFDLICADLARVRERPEPLTLRGRIALIAETLLTVKALAVVGFRLSHAAGRRLPLAGSALKTLTHVVTGADVHHRASVGPGLNLPHPTGVVVSADATVGARCTIHQGVTLASRPDGSPSIGDDVNLSPGAKVIGPVHIGDNVHIGANAVVTHSFPEGNVVLVGIPATVLRERAPAKLG